MKNELTFNFNYCCDYEFRRIFRKFISTLKKQFGKKKFHELTIEAIDDVDKFKIFEFSYHLCSICKKREDEVKISRISIKVKK